jgi:hypothetical protein
MTAKLVNKEDIEREFLHSFKYLCADFPSGELRKHEGPDFLLSTDKGAIIGIEVTRVFKDKGNFSEQSVEATKDSITVVASKYSESHLQSPPAHVVLFFTLSRSLKGKDCQRIAQRVAQVVHDNMPSPGKSVELNYRYGGIQPVEVDLIQISRVYSVARHKWYWIEVSTIKENAISVIENAIEVKNNKLNRYLCNCDECWLVVVAPSFRSSGKIHPDDQSFSHAYSSGFSKTYFLDFGLGQLTPLKTVM